MANYGECRGRALAQLPPVIMRLVWLLINGRDTPLHAGNLKERLLQPKFQEGRMGRHLINGQGEWKRLSACPCVCVADAKTNSKENKRDETEGEKKTTRGQFVHFSFYLFWIMDARDGRDKWRESALTLTTAPSRWEIAATRARTTRSVSLFLCKTAHNRYARSNYRSPQDISLLWFSFTWAHREREEISTRQKSNQPRPQNFARGAITNGHYLALFSAVGAFSWQSSRLWSGKWLADATSTRKVATSF